MKDEDRKQFIDMDARILVRAIREEDTLSEGQATRIIREREATARASAFAEAREAAAKVADASMEFWAGADPRKETWTKEQMAARSAEAGWLAAAIRNLEDHGEKA